MLKNRFFKSYYNKDFYLVIVLLVILICSFVYLLMSNNRNNESYLESMDPIKIIEEDFSILHVNEELIHRIDTIYIIPGRRL